MNAKFFVPFETAKLCMDKGYSGENDYFWGRGKSRLKPRRVSNHKCGETQMTSVNNTIVYGFENRLFDDKCFVECTAPTYHEVLDWLYEKKICITCHPAYSYEGQYNGFQYEMQTYDEDDYPDDIYRTREEALNEAIKAALHMI